MDTYGGVKAPFRFQHSLTNRFKKDSVLMEICRNILQMSFLSAGDLN